MTTAINPTIEVDPFVVTGANASTGYVLQMHYTGAPTPIPLDPALPSLGYSSYASMISTLGLVAVKNLTDYPYAYVVGAGPNNWTTDALAKAAAQADCDKVVAKRNANLAAGGIGTDNPFITIGAPVYGPF